MTISDDGWVAIKAYEESRYAGAVARSAAEKFAMRLMAEHLKNVHGFGVKRISTELGIKMSAVKKLLE